GGGGRPRPREGPAGVENVRSLVLLVRHGSLRFLLTGDLEGAGLAMLLRQPARPVDVLMAPHHGSRRIGDIQGLLAWARPRVIVSCQGLPRGLGAPEAYTKGGVPFLPTWPHGAVLMQTRGESL